MQVRFGNLSTIAFDDKVEANFTPEDIEWIEAHRIDNADFKEDDKLHIFNLPLGIVAGSDIGGELIHRLRAYQFKHQFYVETKESEKDPDSNIIEANI